MADQWEYKIIQTQWGDWGERAQRLNDAGEAGWELVAIVQMTQGNIAYHLKRRRQAGTPAIP